MDVQRFTTEIEATTGFPVRLAGSNAADDIAVMQFDPDTFKKGRWPFGIALHRDGKTIWLAGSVPSKHARDSAVKTSDIFNAALAVAGIAIPAPKFLRRAVRVKRVLQPTFDLKD